MRRPASTLLTMLVVIAGCGGSDSQSSAISCVDFSEGCTCAHSTVEGAAAVSTCDDSVASGAVCCADSGWPSSGTCTCASGSVLCGVVPGYETGADGGPEDACVCSSEPSSSNQTTGATCYPNGTTTQGDALGACCMFSAQAPGSLGTASCTCAAGLHSCGDGGTPVDTCGAANFPTGGSCTTDTTQVTSCM